MSAAASLDAARAFPVLPSLNIDETEDFYRDTLGFSETVHKDDTYLIMRRDALELHFWLTDNAEFCKNSSTYIRGGQIAELYHEYSGKGIEHISPMAVRPWNMEEFYVHDPHGNLLRFGRIPGED